MKKLSILALLIGNLAQSQTEKKEPILDIAPLIIKLAPHVSYKNADKYGRLIKKYSEIYKVDWKIMTAIIRQESNFIQNAVNCDRRGCYDFGLVQINFKNVKRLNLDAGKLLTDSEYSIEVLAQFLENIQKKYKHKDKYWFGRYNSYTPHIKRAYYNRIKKHINKIEGLMLNVK